VKILYTDLDGTMVGPGGNFFATLAADRPDAAAAPAGGFLTLEPARALLDLHRAGVTLVLVSGRTRPQLVEAGRIFGADGFVAELGALVGWDGGRRSEVLTGAMPAEHAGRLPLEVMAAGGLPDELFSRWPGRLQWHSPWHDGHEADAMLRGLVDTGEVERWLAGRGWDWLRLRDNGVLSAHRDWPGLAPDARPPHVYHLMPDGLSKGAAVGWDLARRGLSAADAVAVGDSASDLTMAPYVSRLWVVANGAAAPHMPPLLAGARAAGQDVRVAAGAVGLGWAEAVRDALG
jgi:hydroxymethylpyrimidine pyrophosphatase-like HAD family hydrolase